MQWDWLPSGREPLTSVIELRRITTRTATERGDLTFACYGMHQSITYLLMRNDPLDVVWRESEMALDFARKARFRDVVDLIVSQQRFIASMQGRNANVLHLRRAIRPGGVRGASEGRTDANRDLPALDSRDQGAVPLRQLLRGPGGSGQGAGAALDLRRTVAAARLFLLHCAVRGGAL